MPYNDQTWLHNDLTDLYPDEVADLRNDLESELRANYLTVRSAIIELATGARVVRLTINGKSTEYGQTDIATLRIIRDELAEELRILTGRNAQYRCHRAMTSKGF